MNGLIVALALAPMIFRQEFSGDNSTVRPMATSLVGQDVKQINDFRRARNTSLITDDYCYIEAMSRDGLVLTERREQAALEQMYRGSPASFDMMVSGNIRLTVGIYEKCAKPAGDEKGWGSAIVATKGGKIVWIDENDGVAPLFLFPSKGKHLAVMSSCMFCGEATEIFHDALNDRFHLQYVGD